MVTCNSRRKFLKTAGIGGLACLAGCAGSGNGGTETIRISTSTESSSTYAATQNMAAVVNSNIDTVQVDASPGDGAASSMGVVDRDNADIGYTENWGINQYLNEEGNFAEFDADFQMGFHAFSFVTPYCASNDDWETIEDIKEADETPTGFLTPPGSTSISAQTRAFEELGLTEDEDYEVANIGYGDVSDAMSEGRVDFSVVLVFNGALPSYMQQMLSQNDVQLLSWSEESVETANSVSGVNVREGDFTEFDDQFVNNVEDSTHAFFADYNYVTARDRISTDSMFDMMMAMYENRDELAEGHSFFNGAAEDDSYWVQAPLTSIPFHPGMAEFLQEIGEWNDEWEIGEE